MDGGSLPASSGRRRRQAIRIIGSAALVATGLVWTSRVADAGTGDDVSPTAIIRVTKHVLPANLPDWSVDFTISPSAVVGADTQTATKASPTVSWSVYANGQQSYLISEGALPAGWVQGTINCRLENDDGPSRATHAQPTRPPDGSALVTPSSRDVWDCDVLNRGPATITVTKTVFPADLPDWKTSFVISPDPDGPAGQEANHQVTKANPSWTWVVPAGQVYTITEITDGGWTNGTITCSGTQPGGPSRPTHAHPAGELDPNQVDASPGDEIHCGVTNLGPPIVKLQKITTQAVGGPFHFVVDNGGSPSLTVYGEADIITTQTNTPQPANPVVIAAWAGPVRVSESSLPPAFVRTSLQCSVTDWQGQPVTSGGGPGSVQANLQNGDTMSCVETNDNAADVSVTKVVKPASFTGDWSATFAISPVPPGETSPKVATKASPTVQWFNLQPGVAYTVTETDVPPGFEMGDLVCSGATPPLTNPPGPSRLPHGFDPGENTFTPFPNNHVTCTQTNYAPPQVYIQKKTYGDVGGPFHFVVNNDDGQKPVKQFGTADITTDQQATKQPASPSAIVVDPGFVKIEETSLPAHWQVTGVFCKYYDADGQYTGHDSASGSVFTTSLKAGSSLSCTFSNEKLSRVTVTKTVRGPAPWSFDMTISPVPPGQPATKTATDVNPTVTWEDLDPGTQYTVTETKDSDYIVTAPMSCTGATGEVPGPGRAAHGVAPRIPKDDLDLTTSFVAGRNDDVQCTIENTAKAKIVITKSVQNESPNDNWSFTFTVNPGNIKRTATKANPTVTFDGLDPDVDYDITEQGPFDPRFGLGTITCGDIWVYAEDGIDEMDIDPGETITCQAVNYRKMTDITVTKTPDVSTVNLGSTVVWTLTVTNNGPTQADSVVVHDDLPAALDLVSVDAPGGWDCSGSTLGNPGEVHCTKGSMAIGESAVITVTTTVNAGIGSDPIVNSVHVSTSTGETNYSNNDDSAEVEPEELPATGSATSGLVGAGIGLIGAGLLLSGLTRRRRAI